MYSNADGRQSLGVIAVAVIATVLCATLVAGLAVNVIDDTSVSQDTGKVPVDSSSLDSGMIVGATYPGAHIQQAVAQPNEGFKPTPGLADSAIGRDLVVALNPADAQFVDVIFTDLTSIVPHIVFR